MVKKILDIVCNYWKCLNINSCVGLKKVFHEVAYKAKSRDDLLAGIDEFLDQVTVLPPGEWDPSIRIEPPKSVPSQVSWNSELFAMQFYTF